MRLSHTTEVPEELWEAARVSRFMRNGQCGRWRLRHFTRTEEEYARELTTARFTERPGRAALTVARVVPPGDYITLQRRMTYDEKRAAVEDQLGDVVSVVMRGKGWTEKQAVEHFAPADRAWVPVMSDTPAEILEHDHAINNATGVVVITGLGLGCLPHALLAKKCNSCWEGRPRWAGTMPAPPCPACDGTGHAVKHIHIIEIDPEVIRLTGKYLKKDPRVTIHKGSAMDIHKFLKRNTVVDYVWHDIWTNISARNFDPLEAEHGISYGMLFDLYAGHLIVKDTGAWAYREARVQEAAQDEERREELEFRARVKALPLDEAVELVYDRTLRSRLGAVIFDGEITEEVRQLLDPDHKLKAHLYRTLGDPDFWARYKADVEDHEDEPDPLGNPNAHL